MVKFITQIVDDTLKREKDGVRRFSKTSLTMLTSWIVVLYMAIDNHIREGFKYEVWLALLTVATGIKIADRISKRIKPDNQTQ